MLMISPIMEPDQPLAYGAPFVTSSLHGDICRKVEIRSRDNRIWGTLLPTDAETYGVFRSTSEPALTLDADQESGRLTAKVKDEIVARAMLGRDRKHLEVSVEPLVDPVPVLMSVLAVVIFDPEEPEPTQDAACMS